MTSNGKKVVGTLVVRGALHQTYGGDEAAGTWVTKTHSATFELLNREFVGIPREGEKVGIGPVDAKLDYWAVVSEVHESDGEVRVVADLDRNSQLMDVEMNEVSDEYEILTMYGHAVQIHDEVVSVQQEPL